MDRVALATAYLWVFWPVIVLAGALAYKRSDPFLARATLICALGQVFIWATIPIGWDRGEYFVMFAASVAACVVKPSSRFLVALCGVNMAGVAYGAMDAAAISFGLDRDALWQFLFVVCICELLVMIWGCGGGLIVNFVHRFRRYLAGLGNGAGNGDLA
jgi:hypothetical protein